MADYTWTFDKSFLVFLLIVFVAFAVAGKTRSLLPMPLIYGSLFMTGFETGILPRDMLLSANMIAVGTIAYNVLVVHSGTMVDLKMLAARKKETAVCVTSALVMVLVSGVVLMPVLGKEFALAAPGSVIGGGASCAIASRLVLEKAPALSVFPWLIFMLQGIFSVPVVTWALKRETKALLLEYRAADSIAAQEGSAAGKKVPDAKQVPLQEKRQRKLFCDSIPRKYKNTAYYLAIIMAVTVVYNLLHQTVLSGLHLNPNVTALLLGLLLGSLGIIDKAPLFKSDSYGLRLLGLMVLMPNTLAGYSMSELLAFLQPLLHVFFISSLMLLLCGLLGARVFHFRPEQGILLTMNCMMGFPVNALLTEQAARAARTEAEAGYIKSRTAPLLGIGTMLISNGLSIIFVSVMAMFV